MLVVHELMCCDLMARKGCSKTLAYDLQLRLVEGVLSESAAFNMYERVKMPQVLFRHLLMLDLQGIHMR
jgi:hypothetical protein